MFDEILSGFNEYNVSSFCEDALATFNLVKFKMEENQFSWEL